MLFENDDVVIQNILGTELVKGLEKEYGMKARRAFKYYNSTYGVSSIEIELTEMSEERYCEQARITISDSGKKEVRRFNWLNPFFRKEITSLEDI